jgi:chemotaxis methyl-accepting protein methylase
MPADGSHGIPLSMSAPSNERIADELACWISSWTGYSPDAIRRDAVSRVVRELVKGGATLDQLYDRATRGEEALVQAMLGAVSVGETCFFRQPEHFRWLSRQARRWRGRALHAWSAGCATGEEAYSLAACLVHSFGHRDVSVLGTDLLGTHVARAQSGEFGPWSVRPSSPLLFPVFRPGVRAAGTAGYVISEALRAHVRFERHNVLDEPPPCAEGFQIILCRNVLLYFSHESARAAAARLASALAPDGVLLFGSLDVSQPPAGFRRLEPAGLNIFERAQVPDRKSTRPSLRPLPRSGTAAATTWRANSWDAAIALHLRALVFIERGQQVSAERMLGELRTVAPDYLPGIFEQALLHVRAGDRRRASAAMDDLLRRCEGISDETTVPGPENLSIEYYRVAARTYMGAADPRGTDDTPARR